MKRNYFDLFSKPNSQKELSFGNQSLIGTDDDDIITGGADDDIIEGFGGADKLDGGGGNNTLSYASSTSGVYVFLISNYAFGGHAEGDEIKNFSNLVGSQHNDVLVGNWDNNIIGGGDGHDIIYSYGGVNFLSGGAGNDVIYSGDGNDTLYGGEGADTLYGGNGSDIFVLSYDYTEDLVKDFADGVDKIGLDDVITFESLSISNADGHTSIADKYDGTIYKVLENITASDITADDFISLEVV